MSEQVDTEDEAAAPGGEMPAGRPGFADYAWPMIRDVVRVTVIVGGFAVALLTVHHGIGFYADPSSEFGDLFESALAVFK